MALKGDRYEAQTDVSFFMDETAERGGVVVISTVGSGVAMDQSASLATYAATPSGTVPLGLLLNDVVNIDQTRQHINWHKDEVQQGSKVALLTEGWVVTNRVRPDITPTAGQIAYVGPSGYLQNVRNADSTDAVATVGRFLSTKDEDGYAKVYIHLPTMA